jgi:hypothetical protein
MKIEKSRDLEALALSQNKRFWKIIDDSIARGKKRASSIWQTCRGYLLAFQNGFATSRRRKSIRSERHAKLGNVSV